MNADQGFRSAPAAPEAGEACGPVAGQFAISAALLLFTVVALPAITGLRRAGGKRSAAHARTPGRQTAVAHNVLTPKIPADMGDPWIMGVPWTAGPDPAQRAAAPPGPNAQLPRRDAQRARPADDYPSWPGRPGPGALHPDHPSWGGGRNDPRWDSTEAVLRQDGYPSWPEPAAPPWRDAEPPATDDGPGWSGGGRPMPFRSPEDRPATGQSTTGQSTTGQPASGPRPVPAAPARGGSAAGPGQAPRPAAGYGPRPGTAPYPGAGYQGTGHQSTGPVQQTGYGPGPGSAPRAGYAAQAYASQPGHAPQGFAPKPGYAAQGFASQPGFAPGLGSAPTGSAPRADYVPPRGPVLQQGATGAVERVPPEADRMPAVGRVPEVGRAQPAEGQVWDAGSVELASWIITEANQQATEIRHEARDAAATERAEARQEAAKLVQQAADQAAATLAAAEQQASRIRAEILKLSADLGTVASGFTQNLLAPAGAPVTKPAADPPPKADPPAKLRAQAAAGVAAQAAVRPAGKAGARSASAPVTKPGVSPRRIKPETQAAGKTKNRQVSAARKVTTAFVALSVAGVATGATELVLHGPAFFVFRANGAGASQTGLLEDQGPGQPNAPGAHHNVTVIPIMGNAKEIPAKGKHVKK